MNPLSWKKRKKLYFQSPFEQVWTGMEFLATSKTSKKSQYILDEVAHSLMARQGDDQTDRKQTFHRTTRSHHTISQAHNDGAEEAILSQTLCAIATSPNFCKNSKCFDTKV